MPAISTIIFYTAVFLSVYVQVFFLVTFFEKRKDILIRKGPMELKKYPGVTIIVPCYNEEHTLYKTIRSLLALDYPKDKLTIFIIDDGSTDNTWAVAERFKKYKNIKIFKKENGGKHTALNLGLEHIQTPFTGCLDADSFVDTNALKRIMTYFDNPQTMAVAPSIMVHNPKGMLQIAQKVEYDMSIYLKKMLGFMGGIHVTPGPFSIFRKKVFDDLGNYRKAHHTEDQEIALRMQEHHYKIDHCPDAYVYTVSPNSVKKLYMQRIRWTYGFLNNLIDYRRLLFRKKYGNVAIFTLPSGLISVTTAMFAFGLGMYHLIMSAAHKVSQINATGLYVPAKGFSLDWFSFNTETSLFLSIMLYALVIVSIVLGRRMTEEKATVSFDLLYFIGIYSVIAPFWLMKAVYNTVFSKSIRWR